MKVKWVLQGTIVVALTLILLAQASVAQEDTGQSVVQEYCGEYNECLEDYYESTEPIAAETGKDYVLFIYDKYDTTLSFCDGLPTFYGTIFESLGDNYRNVIKVAYPSNETEETIEPIPGLESFTQEALDSSHRNTVFRERIAAAIASVEAPDRIVKVVIMDHGKKWEDYSCTLELGNETVSFDYIGYVLEDLVKDSDHSIVVEFHGSYVGDIGSHEDLLELHEEYDLNIRACTADVKITSCTWHINGSERSGYNEHLTFNACYYDDEWKKMVLDMLAAALKLTDGWDIKEALADLEYYEADFLNNRCATDEEKADFKQGMSTLRAMFEQVNHNGAYGF